jgi:hypothetical protein
MHVQPRDHSLPNAHPLGRPSTDDYLLVPRTTMAQLQSQLSAEQIRFPARKLRQALRIIQHLLGDKPRERA